MLTEILQALTALLADYEAPLYLAGCVPTGTSFPYLVADFCPSMTGSGRLVLTLWCGGGHANAERFRLTDALLSRLPPRGMHLRLNSGVATLRMTEAASFLSDREALGTQTVWTLCCYPAA